MNQDQSTLITLEGHQCVALSDAAQLPRMAQLANSFWCPLGPAVGRAWLLMLRGDLDKIRSSQNIFHELVFQTRCSGKTPSRAVFGKLLLIQSQRLTPGKTDDPNSLHLVELADKRWLVDRFSDTGNLQFNIRAYAQSDDYLSGASGYTWTSAIAEIWNTMSSILGSFPGLPGGYTPHGVPENLRFTGVNAWSALNQTLSKIGCAVAYDPIEDTFSIVLLGSQQANLPSEIANGEKLLDAEPLEEEATKFPETIRVYFHTHYRSFGQERDTELTTNWSLDGHTASVDIATGLADAQPGTVLALWDDLPNLLDEDNVLANSADLQDRANQRATNWINDCQTSGRRRLQVFPGIVNDVLPGSQIKVVLWRAAGPSAGGTVTQIVTHPALPARIMGGSTAEEGVVWEAQNGGENFSPPDLAQRSYPNYPRLCNIVQVVDSQSSSGDVLSANADGLHPGRVRRWVAGAMDTLDDCWIRFVDDHDTNAGDLPAVNFDFYGPARLSGIETSGGTTKPIYLTRRDSIEGIIPFTLTATLTLGGSAAATNDDTGGAITVIDTFSSPGRFSGPSGYTGWARLDEASGNYEIIAMDRKARFIKATLSSNMSGGSASATAADFWDGIAPVGTVTIADRCQVAPSAVQGDCALCCWDDIDDVYVVIAADVFGPVIPFTLTATLALGGSAAATNDLNGAAITVQDVFDLPGKFSGPAGYEGFARCNNNTGLYEIVNMERLARFINATLNADYSVSTAATVSDSWDGVDNTGATVAIADPCGELANLKQGNCVTAVWHDVNGQYVGLPTSDLLVSIVCAGSTIDRDSVSKVITLEFDKHNGFHLHSAVASAQVKVLLEAPGDYYTYESHSTFGGFKMVPTQVPRLRGVEVGFGGEGYFRSRSGVSIWRGGAPTSNNSGLAIRTGSEGLGTGAVRYAKKYNGTGGSIGGGAASEQVVEETWVRGLKTTKPIEFYTPTGTYEFSLIAGLWTSSNHPDAVLHDDDTSITAALPAAGAYNFCAVGT